MTTIRSGLITRNVTDQRTSVAECTRQPAAPMSINAHGASLDLLDRALVGWERFLGSFEGASDG